MLVKRFDLHGFKSFADKTRIDFTEGITAIVGPNGCGKSNICDAFRWVLGERRARLLRGARMEDVIFNGTETRHSQGMAEVTVVIDNSSGMIPVDYREVVVTRRLYRSGESEFLLNRTSCRLRDVVELFMDTGLSKSAYSVIGQGQMDLVLSSKPEERRFLFEEAAGIVKYQTRQKAALRKLEAAENNLMRLDDIILEVRRQMRSMRRQASAARRYKERRDLLRQLEVRTAYASYEELTRESTALETKLITAQQEREGHSAALSTAETDRESLSGQLLETDRELTAGRGRLHDLETETDRLERLISVLRERLTANGQAQERAQADIADIEDRAKRLSTELEQLAEREARAETESARFAEQLAEREAEREDVRKAQRDAVQRADKLREQSAELARRHTEIVSARDKLRYDLERIQEEEDAVAIRLAELETLVKNAETEIERAQTASDTARVAVEQAEESVSRHEENIRRTAAELAATEQQLETLNDEHSRKLSRLESIESLHEQFEGYYEGPRTILAAHREGTEFARGVHGAVADLIRVDSEHELAIESVLGERAQWVVVGTVGDARGCVEHLTEARAGRAVMVPLEQIEGVPAPPAIDSEVAGESGVVARAAELVECRDEYRAIVEHMLGDTLVVRAVEDGLAIRDRHVGTRLPAMVAADGTVVGRLGTISGGRTNASGRGLIGRRAEIDELREQVTELEGKLASVQQTRDGQRSAVESARVERDKSEAELRKLAVHAAETSRDVEERRQDGVRFAEQLAAETQRLERLNTQHADTDRQVADEDNRLSALEKDRDRLDLEIEGVARDVQRLREAEDECNGRITDARIKKAESEQARAAVRAETARVKQLADDLGERSKRRTRELDDARTAAVRIAEEIHESEQGVAAVIAERDEAQAALRTLENRRHEMLGDIETVDGRLKNLRNNVQEIQQEVHSLELELTQKRDYLTSLEQRIEVEYGVRLRELTQDEVGSDEMTPDERNAEVARLRERLAAMGSVNLMAIDEQTDLEKRYEFLVGQRDDLEKAKTSLVQIVDRFNRVTEQMFLETFEEVRTHFHDLFRLLFGGGQARLHLVDEENVLESGIDISVRPPGKKMQLLELFSGGERALIAIALLFAIFKCKPSPFCILDEVDAPLDDANITRFLDMLAEFARATQFVIITHNKITMARADVLYGVTMAEHGVSQMISTRLAEVDDVSA